MVVTSKPRRSLWMFGLESEEPSEEQRSAYADKIARRIGKSVDVPPKPDVDSLNLRAPRVKPPDSLADICSTDDYERALHAHNNHLMAFKGSFPTLRT